jgi:dienelactone hydrolase
MGNAVAASGMIGVVYGTRDDPYQDLDDAMNWLTATAADLGIDQAKIAAWMWSAHTLTGLRVIMDEGDRQDDLSAAVVYYGWLPYEDIRAGGPPIQLVRATEDLDSFLESQDRFLTLAAELGVLVEVEEVQGPHSFNIEAGYEDLTVEAFLTTLDYLQARSTGSD